MGKRLYVGNLSYHTTEEGLRSAFEGAVSVKVITDRETGRSRGFGFVEYGTDNEAQQAIEDWDGRELDGRSLRVNEAEEKPRRSGGRSHGGDFSSGGDHGSGDFGGQGGPPKGGKKRKGGKSRRRRRDGFGDDRFD